MTIADLIKLQLEQLNDHIRSFAAIYWTWYTFFWPLNALALGWLFTTDKSQKPTALQQRIAVLFWFLSLQSVLAATGVTFALWHATHSSVVLANQLRDIAYGSTSNGNDSWNVVGGNTYPVFISLFGVILTVFSLAALMLLWHWLYYTTTKNLAENDRMRMPGIVPFLDKCGTKLFDSKVIHPVNEQSDSTQNPEKS